MSGTHGFDGGQIAILVLDIACILLIIGANVFVIVLFLSQKKLRIASNYYIISLCGANLLAGCFGLPAEMMVFFSQGHRAMACRIFQYFIHVIDCAEIYSLVLISYDRRRVVLSKLQHHSTSMRRAVAAISVTWFASVLYGFRAPFMYSVDLYVIESGVNISECGITHYGDHRDTLSRWFIALDFLLLFLLPLVVIAALYVSLVQQLRRKNVDQSSHDRTAKVIRIVSSVIGVFFVCNVPTRVLDIYVFLGPGIFYGEEVTREVFDLIKFSNFGLNVIIYVLVNDGFRSSAHKIFARMRNACRGQKIQPVVAVAVGVSVTEGNSAETLKAGGLTVTTGLTIMQKEQKSQYKGSNVG